MTQIPVHPDARALIFDLDGTLADTMALHWRAFQETFALFGVQCPQSWVEGTAGIPTADMVAMANREFGFGLDVASFAAEKERRFTGMVAQARPLAATAQLVRDHRGRLPMAVATSAIRANAALILDAIGLASAFDAVVTQEDIMRQKPAPDIFLEAARRLQVEPQHCQAFEDAEHGLRAALDAGMIVTDVRPYLNPQGHSR